MKIKINDKITFLQNLSIMIKSGISIIDALEVVGEDVENKALNELLKRMIESLSKGESVNVSLKKEKGFLNQAHMGILEAGELSGQLYESIDRIKSDLQQEYDLWQKIKAALTYPAIVLLALVGIGGGIIIFILPKIANVFTTMGMKLPLATRIMVGIGQWISQNTLLMILGTVALVVGLAFLFKSTFGRKAISFLGEKLPVVNSLINDINFTRFTRTLAVMVHSGVNIDQSIEISCKAFPYRIREKITASVVESVKKGKSIAESFKEHKEIFPGVVVRMVAVGESSGNLNEVLEELSKYFDRRVESKLAILTNMLEPLIMLLVGLVIGGAVLSIISPIYNMVGQLQQTNF